MTLFLCHRYKLIFLMYCIKATFARHSNIVAHFVQPRQAYYYDDKVSPVQYENDGIVCPDLNKRLELEIEIEFKKCTRGLPTNGEIMLVPVKFEHGCVTGGVRSAPPFTVVVRQSHEVEPSTSCPILEVEIGINRAPYFDRCFLMWGQLFKSSASPWHVYSNDPIIMYSDCKDKEDQNIDNPFRIFTLIPSLYERADGRNYLSYSICPFSNRTCDDVSMTVTYFPQFKQLDLVNATYH